MADEQNTVAFVQDWLASADYDPSQFDRDFAAAIDARTIKVQADILAEHFCATPLPDSVCADLCATQQGAGRYGTNLMTVAEAAQVLRQAMEAAPTPDAAAGASAANGLRFYTLPFAFHEPADNNGAAYVRDANGQAVAMMMWPGHTMEDEDAAVAETYALGRSFAAAPKVASDTGAGFTWPEPKLVPVQGGQKLNPDRVKAAFELLNGELVIGEQFQLIEMMLDGTEYTVAELATPTDATDGATGGGEVPTGVPSQVPSSASHDDDEHGGIVTMAYMMGAKDERDRHAKATTPGGDLLEQAAFKRMHDWLRYEASAQEVGPVNDLHIDGDTWDHVFAPALKAAGDGGEA